MCGGVFRGVWRCVEGVCRGCGGVWGCAEVCGGGVEVWRCSVQFLGVRTGAAGGGRVPKLPRVEGNFRTPRSILSILSRHKTWGYNPTPRSS